MSCRTRRLRTAIVLAALVVPPAESSVLVQEEREEKVLGWADSAELSFVATAGNSEARTLGFRNVLTRTWEKADLTLEVKGLRAQTATITRTVVDIGSPVPEVNKTSVSETTAESYTIRSRYDRNISERTFWFASGAWNRDPFAGIRNRYQAAGGLGRTWLDSPRRRFLTTYGLSVTRQHDVGVSEEATKTFAGLRGSLEFWRKLTGNTELQATLIADESLSETDDLRLDGVSSVKVSMTDNLAIKVSFGVLFDNLPSLVEAAVVTPDGDPTGRKISVRAGKVDTQLTTALVLTF